MTIRSSPTGIGFVVTSEGGVGVLVMCSMQTAIAVRTIDEQQALVTTARRLAALLGGDPA